MRLILQSISRRAAFVLSLAPMGPICFTALSLSLQFNASYFLSHLSVPGSLFLFGCGISFVSFGSLPFLSSLHLIFVHCIPSIPISPDDMASLWCRVSARHISSPPPRSVTFVTLLAKRCLWQWWLVKRDGIIGKYGETDFDLLHHKHEPLL